MEVEHRQNAMGGLTNRRLMNYYNQMSGLNQNVLGYEMNRRLGSSAGMNTLASQVAYDEAGLNSGYDQADLGLNTYDQSDLPQQSYKPGNQLNYNQALGLGYGQQNQLGYNRQGLNYNQGYNDLYNDQNLMYSNYAGYGYTNPYGQVDRLGFNDYDYNYSPPVSYAYGGGGGCSVGGVSPLLGLIVLAGARVGFYFLWEKVQSIGGRQQQLSFIEFLDFVYKGKMDFVSLNRVVSNSEFVH